MFERFRAETREAVVLAQQEARELRHSFIGTEHLLLALARSGRGPAAEALRANGLDHAGLRQRVAQLTEAADDLDEEALAVLGIDLAAVRQATEAAFGPGALDPRPRRGRRAVGGHIPFSKRAKKVLELSLREAVQLRHNHIGTGHLLLGLIREGEGLAAMVIVAAGVELPALRADVMRLTIAEAEAA